MKRTHLFLVLLTMVLAAVGYVVFSSYNESKAADLKLMTERLSKPQHVLSIYGAEENRLREPMDVAVGKDGRIYVADAGNSRVAVFNEKGDFLFSFGDAGDGKLFNPNRIILDGKGQVLVVDPALKQIKIFDSDGRFIRELSGNSMWGVPGAIALGPEETAYIADHEKHKILVFNKDAELKMELGKEQPPEGFPSMDLEEGRFNFPNGLAINQQGQVWIADSNNARLQIFDPRGDFVQAISGFAKDGTRFFLPRDIAFDGEGKAYVADALGHKIFVFKGNLEPVLSFGEQGLEEGKLFMPTGIAVDAKSNIYIAEKGAHRVSVYTIPITGKVIAFGAETKPVVPLAIIATILAVLSSVVLKRRRKKLSLKDMPVKGVRLESTVLAVPAVLPLDTLSPDTLPSDALHTIDLSRCFECGNCTEACRKRHGIARFDRFEGQLIGASIWSPSTCRQCRDKYCVIACPKGAIKVGDGGLVTYISDDCIGCGLCAKACPVSAIKIVSLEEVEQVGRVVGGDEKRPPKRAIKCDLCHGCKDRACEHNCPTGAFKVSIDFGRVDEFRELPVWETGQKERAMGD